MNDTIPCPTHGDTPAVAFHPDGFTQCRACWYREWLIGVLTWRFRARRVMPDA